MTSQETPQAQHNSEGITNAQAAKPVNRLREIKLAGWAGIIPTVVGVIPFYISGTFPKFFPYVDDSPRQIFAFYASHPEAVKIQSTTGIAFLFYLWFGAGILELLRAPGQSRILSRLTGWAMTCLVLLTMVNYTIWATLGFWFTKDPSNTAIVAMLYRLDVAIFLFLYPFFGLFLACAGLTILRTDVLPRWLGISGLVLAVLTTATFFTFFVGTGPLRPVSLLNFTPSALGCVWVMTAGICMVRWQPPPVSGAGKQPDRAEATARRYRP